MKFVYFFACLFVFARLSATNAPDFTVTSSDNQTLKLYQNYISQGKLVVLEAFFTTCPPCNTHAPLMQNLYTQLQAQYPGKVEFILLSTLSTDTNVKVAQYKTSKGLTMPAAGANGNSQLALQPYTSGQFGPFQGTPTFVVIAPTTGEMFYDIRGNSASETMGLLQQKVDELLATPCSLFNFFGGLLENPGLHVQSSSLDTVLNTTGTYSLKNFQQLQGQSTVIRPLSNVNPLEGLTTYDLVLISKHILGIQPLLCDWQKLAADVNCSGSITTLDIVLARKALLGITTDLPCGSYRFIPDSIVTTSATCQDFYGVKIGDVNGNSCDQVQGDVLDRAPVFAGIPDRQLAKGAHVHLDLTISDDLDLEGLQAEIIYNPELLKINEIRSNSLPDFDESSYALPAGKQGAIPVSWVYGAGKHLAAGTAMLTLDITALDRVNPAEAIGLNEHAQKLAAQVYTGNNHIRNLLLRRESGEIQVYPNPTAGRLNVSTSLAESQLCTLQLADVTGRIVFNATREGVAGLNEWALEPGKLPAGLYFLRLNGLVVKKIDFE